MAYKVSPRKFIPACNRQNSLFHTKYRNLETGRNVFTGEYKIENGPILLSQLLTLGAEFETQIASFLHRSTSH